MKLSEESRVKCHDCGCLEGQIHEYGCDMERCPFCGGQLITCDCCYRILDIDASEGTWAYNNGLTVEQTRIWLQKLSEEGRVPYIRWPNVCSRCGVLEPALFYVSDKEWEKYIQKSKRGELVCRSCFDEIKELIDQGVLSGAKSKKIS